MCTLDLFFNYIIYWILGQALQDYHGVPVVINVHISNIYYADDIVLLKSSYREMQDLLEAVSRQE